MQPTHRPTSKGKVLLTWLKVIGILMLTTTVIFWFTASRLRHQPPATVASDDTVFRTIFYVGIGAFFLVAGIGGDFLFLATDALTFDFNRPVYKGRKARVYVANIIVPLVPALGLGF